MKCEICNRPVHDCFECGKKLVEIMRCFNLGQWDSLEDRRYHLCSDNCALNCLVNKSHVVE